MMRSMCSFDHGIGDNLQVKVLSDDRTMDFNNDLERYLSEGWRIIQPVETQSLMPSSGTFAKTYHTVVIARPRDFHDR